MSERPTSISGICLSCRCEFKTWPSKLRSGRGKFCSRPCATRAAFTTHGHSSNGRQSPTYVTWSLMRARCQRPTSSKYGRYGGVGITVAAEWNSFEQFLSDMGERPKGKTLDRIDGSKGYFNGNCRWATPLEQSENTKWITRVIFHGHSITVPALARHLGLSIATLTYRTKNWPEARWTAPCRGRETVRAPLYVAAAGP